ncbi:MAG TPA: hypothetical protein DIV41_08255 [Ruminococcaceae bacterium]|nr:hypothetical protein [Oscillospiraceae bacterium]
MGLYVERFAEVLLSPFYEIQKKHPFLYTQCVVNCEKIAAVKFRTPNFYSITVKAIFQCFSGRFTRPEELWDKFCTPVQAALFKYCNYTKRVI